MKVIGFTWLFVLTLILASVTPAQEHEKRYEMVDAPAALDIISFFYHSYFVDKDSVLIYEGEQNFIPISIHPGSGLFINATPEEIEAASKGKIVDIVKVYKPLPVLVGNDLEQDIASIEATGAFVFDRLSSGSLAMIDADLAKEPNWILNRKLNDIELPMTYRDAHELFIDNGLYNPGVNMYQQELERFGDGLIWEEGIKLEGMHWRDLVARNMEVMRARGRKVPFKVSPVKRQSSSTEWSIGALPPAKRTTRQLTSIPLEEQ